MTKMIIVEDDSMISEIYQKKFSEAGYDVAIANNGEQVLGMIKKEPVDIILLDLMMPKMDGFETTKAIRKNPANKNLKILIVSNLSQKEQQDEVMKLGADGFIVKANYSPSQLVKEVSRLIDQEKEEIKNEARINSENQTSQENKENEIKNQKKVLLIEDEDVFIEMFGKKLKQEGYYVESANSGEVGLEKALQKKFDIFILDVMMPVMTGEEIIENLKLNEKTKNVPIIILASSLDDEIEEKIRAEGIKDIFIKTKIIPSELAKKVIDLIGK